MTSDNDDTSRDPDHDATMAELFSADNGKQPIPPRLKELAERLKYALAEARKRRDH